MIPKLVNYEEQVTENDINNFELKYCIKLPKEYKEFLLETNGGMTDSQYFEFKANWDYVVGVTFFSLVELKNKIVYYGSPYYDTPENIFPIAEDQAQNLICISLKAEDYGKIYLWEAQFVEEIPDYSNIFFISNTLDELFQQIKS